MVEEGIRTVRDGYLGARGLSPFLIISPPSPLLARTTISKDSPMSLLPELGLDPALRNYKHRDVSIPIRIREK